MTDWGGDTPWDKDEGEGDAVIARTGSREDDKSRAARVPRQRADGDVMCLTSRESRPGRGQGERASPSHIVGRARGAERLSAPLPGRRFKALRLQFSSLGSDESCGTFFRGPPSRGDRRPPVSPPFGSVRRFLFLARGAHTGRQRRDLRTCLRSADGARHARHCGGSRMPGSVNKSLFRVISSPRCPLPRRRGDATDVIHFIINPTELRVAEVATRRSIFSRDAGARVVQPGAPPHTS